MTKPPWAILTMALASSLLTFGFDLIRPECLVIVGPDLEDGYRDYVAWSGNNAVVFEDRASLYIVDVEGTRMSRLFSDAEGETSSIVNRERNRVLAPDVAPDGSRIVFGTCRYETRRTVGHKQIRFPQYEIATLDVGGTNVRRLTRDPEFDHFPQWSPDGSRIAFVSRRGVVDSPAAQLYTMTAGGTDLLNLTPAINASYYPPKWSPDGSQIAFVVYEAPDHVIYVVGDDGHDLVRIGTASGGLSWHPDSSALAFIRPVDVDAKQHGLYIAEPDGSAVRLLATLSDVGPWYRWYATWSPTGEHIAVTCASVCVFDSQSGSLVGQSTLFTGRPSWSPDGSTIAVLTPFRRASPPYTIEVFGDDATGVGPTSFGRASPLYTMAPDGSDINVLVTRGYGLVPTNSGWEDESLSMESCSDGFVVGEPEEESALVADCEALIRIRDQLVVDQPINWGPGIPIDQWYGVTVQWVCDPGQLPWGESCVTPSGPLAPAAQLMSMVASNSILTPRAPLDWSVTNPSRRVTALAGAFRGTIPSRISDLSGLRSLSLEYVGGAIPGELGLLLELRDLHLRNTGLTGIVPDELSRLRHLRSLVITGTRISGPIPAELGQLQWLTRLILADNALTGTIPESLGNLDRLKKLDLRQNQLSGHIPAGLGDLNNLVHLDLSHNPLTGHIPAELGGLRRLQRFWLQETEVSGTVPNGLAHGDLERLGLPDNFSGCLSSELVSPQYENATVYTSRLILPFKIPICVAKQYAFAVHDTAPLGHRLGRLRMTDSAASSYRITQGNEDNNFQIDPLSGEITVIRSLESASLPEYTLTIEALSSQDQKLTATVHIEIESFFDKCLEGSAVERPYRNMDLTRDCATLLSIGDELLQSNPEYHRGPGWRSSPLYRDAKVAGFLNWRHDTPITQWLGITIGGSPSRVEVVDLDSNTLKIEDDIVPRPLVGEIPTRLGELDALRFLTLEGFDGTIPAILGMIPSLEILNVYSDGLTGCIPQSIRRMNIARIWYPDARYCE